jgi:2,3-diaminopropionate biosynthesis protein SbnA
VTPIARVDLVIGGAARLVHLKLERENPGGSLKDRTARSLVSDLERRGVLATDSVLIESTSGNLGVSLARIAHAKDLRFVAVVDPAVSEESARRMRAFGARVEMVRDRDATGGFLLSRLARVRELCSLSASFVWPDQYRNPANPRAHELGTGPEILRQMGGRVDAVLVAVSTGGTLAGTARFFRRASPATRLVAVDASGSVALGGRPGPRLLTGIGASQRSRFLSPDLFDERILVSDGRAFALCRALARATGLRLGGSSGAVIAAAAELLERHEDARRIVCLCPDGGDRYRRSIFDDGWLARHGLNLDKADLGPVEAIAPAPIDGLLQPPVLVR